jgi:cytidyltransferase-like protein
MITVAVSGGFDPIHNGHIRMFKEAKKLGDRLVVILNNDDWLRTKKGYVFMPEEMRAEIISELKCVNEVYITKHSKDDLDRSVCKALEEIKPDIFANGGDRFAYNVPERGLCERLGIRMIFNIGGEKIASSSELVKLSNIVFGHDDDQEFIFNNVLGLKGELK